jgi:hypothetical protein
MAAAYMPTTMNTASRSVNRRLFTASLSTGDVQTVMTVTQRGAGRIIKIDEAASVRGVKRVCAVGLGLDGQRVVATADAKAGEHCVEVDCAQRVECVR